MKTLLTLIAIVSSSLTFAGPLVSGGRPHTENCSGGKLELHIAVLGKEGGGVLTDKTTRKAKVTNLECVLRYEVVPQMVNTQLLFTCENHEERKFVKIYGQIEGVKTWAVVVGETSRGVPSPKTLQCKN